MMTLLTKPIPVTRYDLRMALVVTRREVRDAFRDWRMVIPVILLTTGFPALMNFTARRLLNFVEDFGAEIVANQLIPFLLLVVGFFPISFSLIIALETFVGEKERKSMEPLLTTPLSNMQLYIGKMLASLIPPICASYLGMAIYLIGLYVGLGWLPTLPLFVQTILLTTIQGLIMVAGAVIVSSQTTSVRAANLLASFIIVPMALLIQFEAGAMFWGNHTGLWWLIVALAMTAVVLIRMGLHIFNREELLGRDIDQIRLRWMWQQFWNQYSGRDKDGRYPRPLAWYKQTWQLLPKLRYPALILLVGLVGTVLFSISLAHTYQLPPAMQAELTGERMVDNLDLFHQFIGSSSLAGRIFMQNIRAIMLWTLLGVFTFGVLGVFVFMLPWGMITYIAVQFSLAGQNPFTFLLATVVPHASIELPALLIAAAASLRWHTTVIAPPPNRTLSEGFLMAAGDFFRLFIGVVIPLLLIASFIEASITPEVLVRVYGG